MLICFLFDVLILNPKEPWPIAYIAYLKNAITFFLFLLLVGSSAEIFYASNWIIIIIMSANSESGHLMGCDYVQLCGEKF